MEQEAAAVCGEGSEDGDGMTAQEDPLQEPPPMPDLTWEWPLTPDPPREPLPTPDPPAADTVDVDLPAAVLQAATTECRSSHRRCRLSQQRWEGEDWGGGRLGG